MIRRAAVAVAVTALVCSALAGCRGARRDVRAGVPESVEGRFPHRKHAQLACTECHAQTSVLAGRPAVPGAADHAPCDREQCHRDRFLAPPGAFCAVCHSDVDATGASPSPVVYPPERGPRALASRFSHRAHLDYAAMEKRVGFHVSCTDCHETDARGELTAPGHAVCARCHAPSAAPAGAPPLDQCAECHAPRSPPPSRRRQLIVGDLHFTHKNHRRDRAGVPIRCTECHLDTADVTGIGRHAPPPTRACEVCHDDNSRVPSTMRMRVCETCHTRKAAQLAQLAPRSHLPAPRRPEDHTVAFRRDHGIEARDDPAGCAKCHRMMSGSPRDACDECHQVMRPVDHVITWTEYEHGPEARADKERCAVCHKADFCIACHSQEPRSHYPRMEFRQGGHATIARFDYRACVTCHQPDRDCTGSGCHTVRPRP